MTTRPDTETEHSMNTLRTLATALAIAVGMTSLANATDPAYFTQTENMRMTRDAQGILLVEMNTSGGPFRFTAKAHEGFVDAFITSVATAITRS